MRNVEAFGDRLEVYGPAQCPECGERRRVFLRDNDHLVCLECKQSAQEVEHGD